MPFHFIWAMENGVTFSRLCQDKNGRGRREIKMSKLMMLNQFRIICDNFHWNDWVDDKQTRGFDIIFYSWLIAIFQLHKTRYVCSTELNNSLWIRLEFWRNKFHNTMLNILFLRLLLFYFSNRRIKSIPSFKIQIVSFRFWHLEPINRSWIFTSLFLILNAWHILIISKLKPSR